MRLWEGVEEPETRVKGQETPPCGLDGYCSHSITAVVPTLAHPKRSLSAGQGRGGAHGAPPFISEIPAVINRLWERGTTLIIFRCVPIAEPNRYFQIHGHIGGPGMSGSHKAK